MENVSSDELRQAIQTFAGEFIKLKVTACYVRDYRNYYSKWVSRLGVLRALTSLAGVGAWLADNHLAWLWAALILTAQLAEALQKNFPIVRKRQALSIWCRKLDALVVASQGTWDDVEAGELTAAEIRKFVRSLRLQQLRAENKALPHGLPKNAGLFKDAEDETSLFFTDRYNWIAEK